MNVDGNHLKENEEKPPTKEELERKESKEKVRKLGKYLEIRIMLLVKKVRKFLKKLASILILITEVIVFHHCLFFLE